ncbi:hypothetical protein L873DRAFT_1710915 [Choiromyces venosus 120613-1]|uniref:Uncharacterized protein n=1 Tax=Choiromyces venosus 120613-1 TaxID=1336337 RepID=A0A3N4J6I1_9PEZI|nr:hypothetical protein L873DRAFT_1710915 [Choiromyces venosus 120613-1]
MRGYSYLDLAPRENDAAPWLTSWKGPHHGGSKYKGSLREAVELLLEEGVGSHNFNISHVFQNDRGARVNISHFQELVEALVNIGLSVGCLTGGNKPISRGLKTVYMEHQSFFKHNATVPEAVKFLSIGKKLRSGQMIQDFMFTVLSSFELAFPKSRSNDIGPGAGYRGQSRDYRGIDRELWEYLKRQHNEYLHRKRERERRLREYIADMGNCSENSIFLSVRPSALTDLLSSAGACVKARPQAWEKQIPGKRDQVVVEVKTIGNGNNSHRVRRDPNREHERHHDRGQFEHVLAQHMNQFIQEERQRRYDDILPWEVHLHGEYRHAERRFRRERYGLESRDELDEDS